MELTTQQQTNAFLWAFAAGVVIALIYIAMELVRMIFSASRLHIFIGDMIFAFSAFLINFLYAVAMTEGKVRAYVIAAELISFILIYILWIKTIKCPIKKFIGIINNRIVSRVLIFGKNTLESIISDPKLNQFYKKRKKH